MTSLEAENRALRDALGTALDAWADAAKYKGEYLMAKHGDVEEIAELRRKFAPEVPGQAGLFPEAQP